MNMVQSTAEAGALRERVAQLIDAGRTAAARPLLEAARKLSPRSADIAHLAARLDLRDGNIDVALRDLDVAVAEAPTHPGLRKCRAELRLAGGDLDGAARDAAEAVMLDRGDADAKAILGVTMLELRRTAEAVACLSEAVAAAPASAAYRKALAAALEAGGDADAALLALTDGIALQPANVPLRNAAILLCLRRRDFTQTVRLAEQARAVGIADASTFCMKGHALASLGNQEEAALAYQEALKLAPDDPYVRHLATGAGAGPGGPGAGPDYVRTMFDSYADRFEEQLIALGYATPMRVRAALQAHPKIAAGVPLGPVLDLGCGTGLVAVALGDLPLGPITGVDFSRRMLDQAKAKQCYAELREADILADLTRAGPGRWPLITAADVLCYFGDLKAVFAAVHARLEPRGWFVFSTEELLSDHDGNVPGNGSWSLHRQGRHAHAPDYIYELACATGFRVVRRDRHSIRREAGADVPGVLLAVERLAHDG